MDAAPVEVTVETRSPCADATKARAALEEALSAARGPRRSAARASGAVGERPRWIVAVRVERDVDLGKAEAVIRDDEGREVARRSVTERGRSCSPLTRALGAWAALVLDQEVARAEDEDAKTAAATPDAPAPYGGVGFLLPTAEPDRAVAAESSARIIEVGGAGFLRSGLVGASSTAGVTPYVNVQLTRTIFLRPSLALGWATDKAPIGKTSARYKTYGGRVDACRRVPGNYIDRRGIQLDLCAGADLVYVLTDTSLGTMRASFGPAAVLRGELGAGIALELRGGLGANLTRAPIGEEERAPLLVAAGEVGISTRWP